MQRLHGPDGPYRASARRSPEVKVTFVTPDVAILHTRFWIKGEVMHDALSQEDRESIGTRVLRKIDGPMAHRRDAEHRCPARPQALAASVRAKRSRKSPPIAGFSAVSGKSSGSKDCVVVSGERCAHDGFMPKQLSLPCTSATRRGDRPKASIERVRSH